MFLHDDRSGLLVHVRIVQVHLALGEDPSQTSVSWVTQIGSGEPEVQYGLAQTQLTMTGYGYSKILHDQGEAKRNITINVAVMTGLSPRQRYFCKQSVDCLNYASSEFIICLLQFIGCYDINQT